MAAARMPTQFSDKGLTLGEMILDRRRVVPVRGWTCSIATQPEGAGLWLTQTREGEPRTG
jgi:hypothetical protein